ncbi:MAG: hypothetical protein JWN76_3267 [Chitinophagaceae bacterium]|nr:hypothetical protein [Chitinophagaceae bacterium]
MAADPIYHQLYRYGASYHFQFAAIYTFTPASPLNEVCTAGCWAKSVTLPDLHEVSNFTWTDFSFNYRKVNECSINQKRNTKDTLRKNNEKQSFLYLRVIGDCKKTVTQTIDNNKK